MGLLENRMEGNMHKMLADMRAKMEKKVRDDADARNFLTSVSYIRLEFRRGLSRYARTAQRI